MQDIFPKRNKLALLCISPQNTLPALGPSCSGTDPSAWRSLGTVCPPWTPTSWARSHAHALSPPNYQLAGSTASPSPAFAEREERASGQSEQMRLSKHVQSSKHNQTQMFNALPEIEPKQVFGCLDHIYDTFVVHFEFCYLVEWPGCSS